MTRGCTVEITPQPAISFAAGGSARTNLLI